MKWWGYVLVGIGILLGAIYGFFWLITKGQGK